MLGSCCLAKTHLFSQVAHVDLIGDYHEVIGRVDTVWLSHCGRL